jgi:multisubunit Na+/H+ antiporter MnhB subunit
MPRSGVDNPVTGVLLNFRGYDTLLEVGVLLIALLGVWSLPRGSSPQGVTTPEAPGPVLVAFARLLAPLMVLVAAYVTWVGAYAPGGAFQGAAVLGAVGVVFLLIHRRFIHYVPGWASGWGLRVLAGAGFAMFLGVALVGLASGGRLLEYPPGWTGSLILIIELVLTLSIAVILVGLFPRGPHPESPSATGQPRGKAAP